MLTAYWFLWSNLIVFQVQNRALRVLRSQECFSRISEDLGHVKDHDALVQACCDHGAVERPVYVKDLIQLLGIAFTNHLLITFYHALRCLRTVEASQQLLVLQAPDVNVWVLPANCQQLVVGAQREAEDWTVVGQCHQAGALLRAYVIYLNGLIHAQTDDEAGARIWRPSLRSIHIAPLEVPDRSAVIVEHHGWLVRLGRPHEDLRVIARATGKKVASRVPSDDLNGALMTLPDPSGLLRHVYLPEKDLWAAHCCEVPIVLPCYIDDLAWLLEFVERLLLHYLDWTGVPNEQIGLITAWSHEWIWLVPAREDEGALRSEQANELALHVPNSRYVVVRAGQQLLAWVAPLDRRYKVIGIRAIRNLGILIGQSYVSQLHHWLGLAPLAVEHVEVPDVDHEVASASRGQHLLVRVPPRVHYLSLVLVHHHNGLAIALKWDFVTSWHEDRIRCLPKMRK